MDYKDENTWLMLGDCLERMKEIPDGSVDAIICDPPYGATTCAWDSVIPLESMWEQLKRVVKTNGATAIFSSQPFTTALIYSRLDCFKYTMVWKKSKCGSPFTAKYKPLTKHEDINIFSLHKKVLCYYPQMTKGDPYSRKPILAKTNNMRFGVSVVKVDNKGTRYPTTVLDYPQKWRRQDQLHPTQKPVELIEFLVKSFTKEGETVLDFTIGSGTTGVACVNTGRKFIGIEMDEGYFNVAKKRILGENNA